MTAIVQALRVQAADVSTGEDHLTFVAQLRAAAEFAGELRLDGCGQALAQLAQLASNWPAGAMKEILSPGLDHALTLTTPVAQRCVCDH